MSDPVSNPKGDDVTTSDPFDPRYLDELSLRRDLTAVFVDVLDRGECAEEVAAVHPLRTVVTATVDGSPRSLSPAAQDAVVDAWAAALRTNPEALGDPSLGAATIVRRALQVRVRNDGITRRLWVDRTFAGRRAPWARALVGAFGTTAGRGSCRCLDPTARGLRSEVAGWECCGSPWLDNGDLERFIRRGRSNVGRLAAAVRQGGVPPVDDPVCRRIITHEYVVYVGGPDAELVADAYLAGPDPG